MPSLSVHSIATRRNHEHKAVDELRGAAKAKLSEELAAAQAKKKGAALMSMLVSSTPKY